jgi:hypothetical protein
MSRSEVPTMPVDPTTRATLLKEGSIAAAFSSWRFVSAPPVARAHHQLELIAAASKYCNS